MKKKLIILIGSIILVALVFAYTQYNKPHRDVASEKADFILTANELFNAFDENEKTANEKYLDKIIEVSGFIIDENKDQAGNSVLTLEAENAMIGGVLCTLSEVEVLKNDSEVTLKCKCNGFLEDVILTNCSVIN